MWEKVKLGEIVEVISGKNAPKDEFFNNINGLPFIRAGHLKDLIDHNISENEILKIDIDVAKTLKLSSINANTILFAKSGMSATLNRIYLTESECYFVNHLAALSVNSTRNSIKYIYWFLNYFNPSKLIQGESYPSINLLDIKELAIPLPPLPIQERIVEILDKADELRRKDQELQAKYDQLAQAIFIDMFGDPVKNEKGWEVKKLEEVCSKIGSGATPSGGNESYKNEGISLIRSLNIHQNEFKYKDLAYIDEKQADKLKNVIVEENDVLFNITGASVCRTTIVPFNVLPARVNQHVAILRFNIEYVLPFFAVRLLSNYSMNRNLYALATQGGATREAITKEQLQKLEIIVPPIHLQEEFAKKIEIINQLKAQTNAEKSEELFQSLLQKAFKGELVS